LILIEKICVRLTDEIILWDINCKYANVKIKPVTILYVFIQRVVIHRVEMAGNVYRAARASVHVVTLVSRAKLVSRLLYWFNNDQISHVNI